MSNALVIGRIVHYVSQGAYPHTCQPAIVARLSSTDDLIDVCAFEPYPQPRSGVERNEAAKTDHSWHWPETCGGKAT